MSNVMRKRIPNIRINGILPLVTRSISSIHATIFAVTARIRIDVFDVIFESRPKDAIEGTAMVNGIENRRSTLGTSIKVIDTLGVAVPALQCWTAAARVGGHATTAKLAHVVVSLSRKRFGSVLKRATRLQW